MDGECLSRNINTDGIVGNKELFYKTKVSYSMCGLHSSMATTTHISTLEQQTYMLSDRQMLIPSSSVKAELATPTAQIDCFRCLHNDHKVS